MVIRLTKGPGAKVLCNRKNCPNKKGYLLPCLFRGWKATNAICAVLKAMYPLHDGPKLLILKEKHCNRYFHVTNERTLFRIAIEVLRERYEEGWYQDDPRTPDGPGFVEAAMETLPQSLRAAARQQLDGYKHDYKEWETARNFALRTKRALKDKNGRLAWTLLNERSGHEYEQATLQVYETA